MKTCEKVIELPLSYGVYKEACGRTAVIQDVHGRHLCQRHYNRWFKKINKKKS